MKSTVFLVSLGFEKTTWKCKHSLLYVLVDFCVEVHQESSWEKAEDQALAPVHVSRVDWVNPKFRHVEVGCGNVEPILLEHWIKIDIAGSADSFYHFKDKT